MLTTTQRRNIRRERGNRLKAARAAAGLTQIQAAEALGVTQGYISKIERSEGRGVSIGHASRFATFYGCSIEELFPVRVGA